MLLNHPQRMKQNSYNGQIKTKVTLQIFQAIIERLMAMGVSFMIFATWTRFAEANIQPLTNRQGKTR